MKRHADITLLSETIYKASSGDDSAIYKLLQHYDSYINSLCLCPIEYPDGNIKLGVNEDIKAEIQIHLIQKILQFDCSRYG